MRPPAASGKRMGGPEAQLWKAEVATQRSKAGSQCALTEQGTGSTASLVEDTSAQ